MTDKNHFKEEIEKEKASLKPHSWNWTTYILIYVMLVSHWRFALLKCQHLTITGTNHLIEEEKQRRNPIFGIE